MRRYQIAFFIVLTAVAILAGAAVSLWLRPISRHRIERDASKRPAAPSPRRGKSGRAETGSRAIDAATHAEHRGEDRRCASTNSTRRDPNHRQCRGGRNAARLRSRCGSPAGFRRYMWTRPTSVRKGQPLFTIYSPELRHDRAGISAGAKRIATSWRKVPFPASRPDADSLLSVRRWNAEAVADSGARDREAGKDRQASSASWKSIRRYRLHHGTQCFAEYVVQPGTKLYTIADLSTVWVYAQVFQNDIGRIKVGDSAVIDHVDSYPGRSFPGASASSGRKWTRQRAPPKVRAGNSQPGDASSRSECSSMCGSIFHWDGSLTIPASGVFQSGTRQIAFVDRGDGYFEPREIEIGARAGDDLVVLKGLKAGEHIVTSANFLIDSESQLQAPWVRSLRHRRARRGGGDERSDKIRFQSNIPRLPQRHIKGNNVFRVKLTGADGKPDHRRTGDGHILYGGDARDGNGGDAHMSTTLSEKGGGMYEGPARCRWAARGRSPCWRRRTARRWRRSS